MNSVPQNSALEIICNEEKVSKLQKCVQINLIYQQLLRDQLKRIEQAQQRNQVLQVSSFMMQFIS